MSESGPATDQSVSSSTSAAGIAWNLGDLYADPQDPAIGRDQALALETAQAFAERYRGRVAALSPEELAEAVESLEGISAKGYRALIFAHLRFAADTADPTRGALLQATRERSTTLEERLLFFELEWRALPESAAEALLHHPATARHRHWLERSRVEAPYTLSEPEERILAVKDTTGRQAFTRLFDELVASLECPVPATGKEPAQTLSMEAALALLYHPERERRQAGADGVTAALRPPLRTLTSIFNTLVLDHAENDRLRKRTHMMQARNLANEIDQGAVEALLEACDEGNRLVERYYRLKARLLGLEQLTEIDRYAPVGGELPSCSYPEAQALVLDAYSEFSPEMAGIARQFFDRDWIDAELRPGKTGGGFSAGTLPDAHPYILINYTDQMRDVMTLAHELGHGVHQYLSRPRGLFQMHTPLTMAETASVFGEMLTFRRMMAGQTDPAHRLALLCGKLEGIFATVFRQAAMTRFEESLHTSRRKQGELDAEAIGDLWMKSNQAMFGDALALGPDYRNWWAYISHFIHTPFYCYAYAFGELLVLALYRAYEEEGPSFVPRYMEVLAAGGSQSPADLVRRLGLEVNDPTFWGQGIDLIEGMVAEAETLAATVHPVAGKAD